MEVEQTSVDALMTEEELAEYLNLSAHTLKSWRRLKTGPRYIRLNAITLRYRVKDVNDWLATGLEPEEDEDGAPAA